MQNVISYTIDWPLAKVDNLKGHYIIPFKIIAQTSNKSLETYCQKTYPTLMYEHAYNVQELKQFYEMQNYLRRELKNKNELFVDGLYEYFQQHNWFGKTKKADKLYEFMISNADCKKWNDAIPHLQVYAFLVVDVKKVMEVFDKNNWLRFEKFSNRFLSESFYVKFYQALPMILTFQSLTAINDLITKQIELLTNRKQSKIYKQVKNYYKIDNIEKYKKKIERLDVNKYQITFLNFIDILKLRVKNNKIETAAALYFTSQVFGNKQKQNKKISALNALTFKALHDLEKIQRGK